MTTAGAWKDDAQLVSAEMRKRYARPGETPGVLILVGSV